MLPTGDDPDNFIRKFGGAAYQEKLRSSRQYLDYLLDRTARGFDLNKDEGRRGFLNSMLAVAARIPDAAGRDQFADRLAHKARITEDVIRAEIRKAAVHRQTAIEARNAPAMGEIKPAERGLVWALIRDAEAGMAALTDLEDDDLSGLATEAILRQARSLQGTPADALPETLLERLTKGEARVVEELGRPSSAPAHPVDCVRTLKKRRFDRERADVQREIDRLQEEGAARYEDEIVSLWAKKMVLLQRIEALGG